MQEVLVKIPPTQSRKLRIERFFSDEEFEPVSSKKKPQIRSTSFTHRFVIEDSSEPITINLDNIPRDVIPIELAKEEIQKSYDKGFEEGQMSEMAVAKAEINTFVEKMRTMEGVIQEFEDSSTKLIQQLYDSVISISKDVSLTIMRSEQLTNFDSVKHRLDKIFNQAKESNIFTISLHPDTLVSFKEAEPHIFEIETSKINIVEDENLEFGDCIIETDAGFLEAKIKDELAAIMQKLQNDFNIEKVKRRNEFIKDIEKGHPQKDA